MDCFFGRPEGTFFILSLFTAPAFVLLYARTRKDNPLRYKLLSYFIAVITAIVLHSMLYSSADLFWAWMKDKNLTILPFTPNPKMQPLLFVLSPAILISSIVAQILGITTLILGYSEKKILRRTVLAAVFSALSFLILVNIVLPLIMRGGGLGNMCSLGYILTK